MGVRLARALRRAFRPPPVPAAEGHRGLLSGEAYLQARTLLAAFYAALAFLAVAEMAQWRQYLDSAAPAPRWPVLWLRFVGSEVGVPLILTLHLVSAALGLALPGKRWARVLVFVSWLEVLALKFSQGSIHHGEHLGLLLAFWAIFLPAGWSAHGAVARRVRAATLLVFSGCQALILLTYSMSGMWKVGGVLEQALRGEVHYLHPEGLARQIAAKLEAVGTSAPLGPWLIEHPGVGWLLICGVLYFELFSLWVVARPSLHLLWGGALISLHVFSHLAMGVAFPRNVLWLSLFLVLSPFRPPARLWREAAASLPWIGRLFRARARRGRSRAHSVEGGGSPLDSTPPPVSRSRTSTTRR